MRTRIHVQSFLGARRGTVWLLVANGDIVELVLSESVVCSSLLAGIRWLLQLESEPSRKAAIPVSDLRTIHPSGPL
jgi:hypothetical protein